MKSSSDSKIELKPAAFQIDSVPTLIGLYCSIYSVHLPSRQQFNLHKEIFIALATSAVGVLLVTLGCAVWWRRAAKPQTKKMKLRREIKLKLGFWNLLWQMWTLFAGVAVLIALLNWAFAGAARPTFWIYLTFHLASALLFGLMASYLSWLVTRRLVSAPLTSTS